MRISFHGPIVRPPAEVVRTVEADARTIPSVRMLLERLGYERDMHGHVLVLSGGQPLHLDGPLPEGEGVELVLLVPVGGG
jgi:hypothetical protein